MRAKFQICLILIGLGCTPAADAEEDTANCRTQVAEVRYVGNKVSKADFLLKKSGLQIGQWVTWPELQQARQRIFDTGLYKTVDVRADKICAKTSHVTIEVEEKRYHIVYPRLSRNADGDFDRGLAYRGSNLFGENHRVKVVVSRKDFATGETADQVKLNYDWPLLFKPYHLQWSAKTVDTLYADLTERPTETNDVIAFSAGREWSVNPFGHPIKILGKMQLQRKQLDKESAESNLRPGRFHTLGIRAEYDDVHNEQYRRYGLFLSAELNHGYYWLGSDFNATNLLLEARRYHRLNLRDNLNLRLKASLADEDIFNQNHFTIGGADTVRGVEPSYLSGNGLYLANIEYVMGFRRWPNFRFALFTDVGNVFEAIDEVDDHDWQVTWGFGMRWKIQSFVDTDLVIDYAENPETGYAKIYGGTSLTF